MIFRDRGEEADAAVLSWEADREEHPLAQRALDHDLASVGPDDALHNMETEAGTVFLRRVVGLEDPVHGVGIDAAAGVTNADPDMGIVTGRGDLKVTFASHGLETIANYVVEGLAELIAVEGYRRHLFAGHDIDFDTPVLNLSSQEFHCLKD